MRAGENYERVCSDVAPPLSPFFLPLFFWREGPRVNPFSQSLADWRPSFFSPPPKPSSLDATIVATNRSSFSSQLLDHRRKCLGVDALLGQGN